MFNIITPPGGTGAGTTAPTVITDGRNKYNFSYTLRPSVNVAVLGNVILNSGLAVDSIGDWSDSSEVSCANITQVIDLIFLDGPLLSQFNLPNLTTALTGITINNSGGNYTLDMSNLQYVGAEGISLSGGITNIPFPKLTYCKGYLNLDGATAAATLDFPELTYCKGISLPGAAPLYIADFPKLVHCPDGIDIHQSLTIARISAPLLERFYDDGGLYVWNTVGMEEIILDSLIEGGTSQIILAPNLVELNLPAMTSVNGLSIQGTGIPSLVFPSLETFVEIVIDANPYLAEVYFPGLTGGVADLSITNCALTQSATDTLLGQLANAGNWTGYLAITGDYMAVPSYGAKANLDTLIGRGTTIIRNTDLQSYEGDIATALTLSPAYSLDGISISTCPNLVSIDASALTHLHGVLVIADCPVLESVDISGLIAIDTHVDISGNALTQTAVDNILLSLAGVLYGHTVTLTGGTNASPSATGLAAITTLEGNGNTVLCN